MEEMTKFLEQLATKLGTTAEQLWNVLLQQVNIEIVLCNMWMNILLWGGIGLVVLAVILLFVSANRGWDGAAAFAIIIILATIMIAGIGYYVNYSSWLTLTTNPEYWALKEILKVIQ